MIDQTASLRLQPARAVRSVNWNVGWVSSVEHARLCRKSALTFSIYAPQFIKKIRLQT